MPAHFLGQSLLCLGSSSMTVSIHASYHLTLHLSSNWTSICRVDHLKKSPRRNSCHILCRSLQVFKPRQSALDERQTILMVLLSLATGGNRAAGGLSVPPYATHGRRFGIDRLAYMHHLQPSFQPIIPFQLPSPAFHPKVTAFSGPISILARPPFSSPALCTIGRSLASPSCKDSA